MVLPVVLAATEIEFQMLPVRRREVLALDFSQQRFEVAQPVTSPSNHLADDIIGTRGNTPVRVVVAGQPA